MTPEVEARFAAIEAILAANAQQQAINIQTTAANSESITRLEAQIAANSRLVTANSESITRLEASIATTNAILHDEVANIVQALGNLAFTFDESSRRVELASQVTQASVERLIETLTEKFNSNGHQE